MPINQRELQAPEYVRAWSLWANPGANGADPQQDGGGPDHVRVEWGSEPPPRASSYEVRVLNASGTVLCTKTAVASSAHFMTFTAKELGLDAPDTKFQMLSATVTSVDAQGDPGETSPRFAFPWLYAADEEMGNLPLAPMIASANSSISGNTNQQTVTWTVPLPPDDAAEGHFPSINFRVEALISDGTVVAQTQSYSSPAHFSWNGQFAQEVRVTGIDQFGREAASKAHDADT